MIPYVHHETLDELQIDDGELLVPESVAGD